MLFQPFGFSESKMTSCSHSSKNTAQVLTVTAKKNMSNIFEDAVFLYIKFHTWMIARINNIYFHLGNQDHSFPI